jgi:hypothetical protein
MDLELPIHLENDVEIITRSEDGAFLIGYKKHNGENGLVYWPDRFKRYVESNRDEGKAVQIAQAYLIERIGAG